MATLEELKRRRDVLQARDQSRREIKKIGEDRKKLQREIKDLKNPRTTAFKKMLSKGVMAGGRGTLKLLDDLTRPTPVRRKSPKKRKSIKRKSPKKRRRR